MSNRRPKSFSSLLDPLGRSESGSAMTEFVIGLPIFVMIFSGLGMLFRYNTEAMAARMKTIQELSTRTTAVNNFEDFSPNSGSVYVSGFGAVNFTGSNEDGYLTDSGKKAVVGSQFGELKEPADAPTSDIAAITGIEDSFANNLLDDRSRLPGSIDGWASLISGVLDLTGTNPSIGAGIRYTAITANESRDFYHPWGGNETYNPGTVDLSAPTAATHRAFPVALARLEMNRKNPYRSTMLEFNDELEGSDMDVSGGLPPGSNLSENMGEECRAQAEVYTDCIDDPLSEQAAEVMGSCGGAGIGPLTVGEYDCTVVDVCEDLEPTDDCTAAADDGANIFENDQCDGQPECARPVAVEEHIDEDYNSIDFDGY